MDVPVMDIGEVLVFMSERKMTVPCPTERFDRPWRVMHVGRVDLVGVFDRLMDVPM